jgi:formyltetrahydrofolate synthetase|tara:strand:- start:120 stop:356 length:237 start_codon:yes stop_codon:yes gene_type:complete
MSFENEYAKLHDVLEQGLQQLDWALEDVDRYELPEELKVWEYNLKLREELEMMIKQLQELTHAVELKTYKKVETKKTA